MSVCKVTTFYYAFQKFEEEIYIQILNIDSIF